MVGKFIRILMLVLTIVSILWFGIAFLLSGNFNFDFSSSATGYLGSPEASILYWNIIYVLIVTLIVLMITHSLLRYFERLKDTK